MELREHPRHLVAANVQIIKDNFLNHFVDQKINATLIDISAEGIRIVITDDDKDIFEVNDKVKVLIPLPESESNPIINGVITNSLMKNGSIQAGIKNEENDHLLAELVRAALTSRKN